MSPNQTTRPKIASRVLIAAALAAAALPVTSRVCAAQTPPGGAPAAPAAPAPATPATRPAALAPAEHVIVTVGDERITEADFDAFIADLPARDQAMARGPGRRELAEYLVKMKLLAGEAKRRNLENSADVKRRLAVARDQIFAGALVADVQDKMDDAALRKYFDANRAQLERIAARHVLIRTPGSKVPAEPGKPELTEEQAKAKADQVYQRVTTGKEDFAAVAKAESDDVGSGAEGGDLGSFTRGRMVAPFEQAAFALKQGEVGQPVRSPFGWHVIQVTGRYDTYEQLADQIRQQFGPAQTNELVNNLRKSAKVEFDEAYLGPAMPEMGPDGLPKGTP